MLTSMARLPLNSLPAFRTVAQLQNLRAAAESLHLTHSAVSQQIRGLEEQLGFALFERRGRRVVLNAAGEALLRSVEPALAQLDDGVQAAAAAASGSAQRLRVTTLPSFAQRWLQAPEQNLGLALARELLAADALCDGRLVKLAPLSITYEEAYRYHLVYPPALRDWEPLAQFRRWIHEELDRSRVTLHPPAAKP